MTQQIVRTVTPPEQALLSALAEKVKAALDASLAPNTRRAYRAAWERWVEWCLGYGIRPVPAMHKRVKQAMKGFRRRRGVERGQTIKQAQPLDPEPVATIRGH